MRTKLAKWFREIHNEENTISKDKEIVNCLIVDENEDENTYKVMFYSELKTARFAHVVKEDVLVV